MICAPFRPLTPSNLVVCVEAIVLQSANPVSSRVAINLVPGVFL